MSSSAPAMPTNKSHTAMVLGATGGIGSVYCHALAERGMNLYISGRNEASLQTLASALRTSHGIHVELVVADLASQGDRQRLEELLRSDLKLNWLVNAAGLAQWGNFVDLSSEQEQLLFQVNLAAPTSLIRTAIQAFQSRGGGAIVQVVSAAAYYAVPYLASYCSTKRAMLQMLTAVREEVRDPRVRIQALCPGFVKTEMFLRAGADADRLPKWIWMSADRVVQESIRAVERNRLVCIPGKRYRWMLWATQWAPSTISCRVAGWMFGNLSKYRLKAG